MEIREEKRNFVVLSEKEVDAFEEVIDVLSDLAFEMRASGSDIELDDDILNDDDIHILFTKLCSFLESKEIELRKKEDA